jgi:preprotein translocase subunit SecF
MMTAPSAAGPAPWPFTRWRYAGFAVTAGLLALTLAAVLARGLVLGLDFTGGVLVEARSPAGFEVGALRAELASNGLTETVVQLSDAGRTVLVRVQSDSPAAVAAIREALGSGAEIRSEEAVGPKVSGELLRSGLLASFGAVAAIGIYIWLRFEAKFGAAAFLTTLHDVLLMVGLYAVTGLTFDLTSIAALLLVAGYSINDTVIVFDRIRERLARHRAAELPWIIDVSITDTLRRTLITSGTTLATSVSLMIFGGPVLFGFAAAVTFGIAVGTFSSIFVAAPLVLHLPGRLPGRQPEAEAA